MEDNRIEALVEMLKKWESEDLLKKSFSIFLINKDNIVSRIVIILLSFILAITIGLLNTVEIMNAVSSVILDVILAIFGIVFTGYAFFQALSSGKLLTVLIEDVEFDEKTKQSKNTLHKTNWNFVQLMMQFIVAIFVTLLVKIALSCMPITFCLFKTMWLNVFVAVTLILLYFYYLLVILWRMVSFVFNIYQLFNVYAVTEYLSSVEKNGKEE